MSLGFPAPDVPTRQRRWTPNKGLDDAAFKDECRGWGVDEAVFAARVASLRADASRGYALRRVTYEMDVRGTRAIPKIEGAEDAKIRPAR